MSRPRHGWLLEQLPDAMAAPDIPESERELYVDMPSFVRIFENLANSIDDEISGLDRYFDPSVAPSAFLAWMGSWLGLEISVLPREQQVQLLATAGAALPIRGTERSLEMLLEAFTGSPVEIEDSGGVFGPADELPDRRMITVRLSSSGNVSAPDLQRLIRDELPADAEFRLELNGDVIPEIDEETNIGGGS